VPKQFSVDLLTDLRIMYRHRQLGNEPPEFDLIRNDAEHGRRGAHTLDRHGPSIPLQRRAGVKTIEGRIYGDPPWRTRVTRSYQWTDLATLNSAVSAYVRQNWTVIRTDLASGQRHEGVADAGRLVGRGYDSSGMTGMGPGWVRFREIRQFKVCIRLMLNTDPATPFILSAFPWSSPVQSPERRGPGSRRDGRRNQHCRANKCTPSALAASGIHN
jgi:hypothetical protein